jgi:hypothetical protein
LCIDVLRTFIAEEFMFWYHSTLILYVSLTMSNTCKEILLSDNNLASLGKLRRKSQRIKTTSPPSLDKYFVEPKRDLLDNLEWFTTQHRKENYKKPYTTLFRSLQCLALHHRTMVQLAADASTISINHFHL